MRSYNWRVCETKQSPLNIGSKYTGKSTRVHSDNSETSRHASNREFTIISTKSEWSRVRSWGDMRCGGRWGRWSIVGGSSFMMRRTDDWEYPEKKIIWGSKMPVRGRKRCHGRWLIKMTQMLQPVYSTTIKSKPRQTNSLSLNRNGNIVAGISRKNSARSIIYATRHIMANETNHSTSLPCTE